MWRRRADFWPLLLAPLLLSGTDAAPPVAAPLQLIVPAAGSYTLPVIQPGPRGVVLDSDARDVPLGRYTTGRVTLLNFMYTYCSDPVGCPALLTALHDLRGRLLTTPALARGVQFVSISFDPVNDTPEAMKNYGGALALPSQPLRWHFLTSRSVGQLQPILDELGQSTSVQLDNQGKPTRLYYHQVKLFLLDRQGRVREIYSPAFLQPELIYRDIQTLLLEPQ
ncbi:MAG: SCO family protein [Pseudomonadota bacterium]